MKKMIALFVVVLSLAGTRSFAQTTEPVKKDILKQRIDSLSPEQRKELRKQLKEKRKQMTPEQKQEMRAKMKGRLADMTPEQKAKMKEHMKQRKDSAGAKKQGSNGPQNQ